VKGQHQVPRTPVATAARGWRLGVRPRAADRAGWGRLYHRKARLCEAWGLKAAPGKAQSQASVPGWDGARGGHAVMAGCAPGPES